MRPRGRAKANGGAIARAAVSSVDGVEAGYFLTVPREVTAEGALAPWDE